MISSIINGNCQIRIFTNTPTYNSFACALYNENNRIILNLDWISDDTSLYNVIRNPNNNGVLYILFNNFPESMNLILKNVNHTMKFVIDIPINGSGSIFE